jgi:UDP-N-acetylmuramyl pentapeptide phosphotransferase/UDP-N-acetylglucosamine-1-phosphate transferase
MSGPAVLALALALVAAIVAHIGARAAAASGPMHEPRAGRSSHVKITPSGGGLGIAAGVMAALAAAAVLRPESVEAGGVRSLALLAVIGLIVAAIGALDDVYDWPPRLKVALLGGTSAAVAWVAGAPLELPLFGAAGLPVTPWIGLAGATLWAFTAKNAVNFMDGANGLVGGGVALASAGLAVLAALAGATEAMIAAAALAGALAGFLPVNAPKASVFMGDVGSLFVGAWFAGAALLFIQDAPRGAVYLPPLLLLPILGDVLLTLAWHVKHKMPVLKPHLDHAYQARLRSGLTHARVVRTIWIRSLLLAVLAVGSLLPAMRLAEPAWALGGLALGSVLAAFWWRGDRIEAARVSPGEGQPKAEPKAEPKALATPGSSG